MPILESTLSKWSYHEAGTAFKQAHLPTGVALRRQAPPGLDVPGEPYLFGDWQSTTPSGRQSSPAFRLT